INIIRAGNSNLFLSPIFRETLANLTQATIELYDTDGAQGAARGAAYGANYYKSFEEAFRNLEKIKVINHKVELIEKTMNAYNNWNEQLKKFL
ncbi:MAG: carbohydrate kinase, partial [Melioribacter sp.]|nr:carbohydrate kinase [Melioribacter sp.]